MKASRVFPVYVRSPGRIFLASDEERTWIPGESVSVILGISEKGIVRGTFVAQNLSLVFGLVLRPEDSANWKMFRTGLALVVGASGLSNNVRINLDEYTVVDTSRVQPANSVPSRVSPHLMSNRRITAETGLSTVARLLDTKIDNACFVLSEKLCSYLIISLSLWDIACVKGARPFRFVQSYQIAVVDRRSGGRQVVEYAVFVVNVRVIRVSPLTIRGCDIHTGTKQTRPGRKPIASH